MRLLTLLAVGLTAIVLAACGGSDSDSSGSSGGDTEGGAFPVTIEHKYGSTTVEKQPERVVVAGLREQDAVLALGTVPVATTEWYGKHPGAIFPWAKEAFGDGKLPTVLDYTDGLQIEKIAAQKPDLIIAIYSGMTKKEYDQLSQIAPVIAQPKGQVDYGSTWQQEQLMTGQALGKPDEAQKLVDDTEQLIADQAKEHPEFKGQTAAVVSNYQGTFVYGPQDERSRLLEDLGFEYPQPLRDAFKDEFGGQLSDEKTDDLDVGTLVWFVDGGDSDASEVQQRPIYKDLKVRTEGRDVFIGLKDRVYEATSFPSVLSMPTLLKEYVPRLAAAADGDPKTSTDQQ